MFKYTDDNKRYHTLNYFYRHKFGCKIAKIPLDAGFSCPNKLTGGCIYCSNNSAANIINKDLDVIKQFQAETKILHKKWPDAKFIAYLQAGTNTNTSVDTLQKLCEGLIIQDNCVGIAIATRPDCISDECLNYLSELNKKTFLTIELGLQSSNDDTLRLINRGHTKEDFTKCVNRLHKYSIFTVAHIINGLPYETKEDMLNTIMFLNDIPIDGVKIHMLHIAKNTKLADMYEKEHYPLLSLDEYTNIVCEQLRHLRPEIVIERITGDPIKEELIEPKWLLKKFVVLNNIDKYMFKNNIYQGDML
jgi:hypothetical protein